MHNFGHSYVLNANYSFSKYAYSVPIRSQTGQAVVSAFLPVLGTSGGRWPLVVQKDKGKDFVNARIRKLLTANISN